MFSIDNNIKKIPRPISQQGFTIIEILIVVSIMAIVATLATPSMSRAIANQNIKDTASVFRAALEESRVESVIRRKNVTVEYIPKDSTTAGVTPNSLVLKIQNGTGTTATEEVIGSFKVKDNVTFTPNNIELTFQPTKVVTGNIVVGTGSNTPVTICSDKVDNETPIQVSVSAVTNISVSRSGTCS